MVAVMNSLPNTAFAVVIEICKGHGGILHTFVPASVHSLKDGGSCI